MILGACKIVAGCMDGVWVKMLRMGACEQESEAERRRDTNRVLDVSMQELDKKKSPTRFSSSQAVYKR